MNTVALSTDTLALSANPLALWDEALIRRYDLSGPRYTSYPTAPQFQAGFTQADWHSAMAHSNAEARPLSLYVHIPFCDTVCYYCGCNKIITANKQKAVPYLAALYRELALQAAAVTPGRPVLQLHLGGGTPTYLDDDQLGGLMAEIRAHFALVDDATADYSIEIHPQTVTPQRLQHLRRMGFNRLSLGVQDFNPVVQRAVNRFNSLAEVRALIEAARDLAYQSVNLDVIYGLPHQTPATFRDTLAEIIALRPDRLSVFNYAHLPDVFKVQKQIDYRALPEPQDKLRMLQAAIEQLTGAGYVYIGMDHFALPSDALAILQAEGRLHRNFQGYATHGHCDLLAFGVSAINHLGASFAQNHKSLEPYLQDLSEGRLPIAKGWQLSLDDRLRRAIINQIICHFALDFAAIEADWGLDFRTYFAEALKSLAPLAADGLIRWTTEGFAVEPRGRLLVRCICMAFDAYLPKASEETQRFSRII
jgi:oxygen-independent coproporphyrinogen III oxidase